MKQLAFFISVASSFGLQWATAASIDSLQILPGCWRATHKGATVEERWGTLTGDLMLGTSKTVVGKKTTEWEFLKIEVQKTEAIYTPYFKGSRMVSFLLDSKKSDATKAVFGNSKNDFPKEIVYEKTKDGLRVQLIGGAGTPTVDYDFASIDCD